MKHLITLLAVGAFTYPVDVRCNPSEHTNQISNSVLMVDHNQALAWELDCYKALGSVRETATDKGRR